MLWQQKYFSNDPFRSLGSSSIGQSCVKQPDGSWSCPAEGVSEETKVTTQSAEPVVSDPAPVPVLPIAIGGAALVAAALFLTR